MEIDELPENDERLLKKPEILRDEHGRFEQRGTGLIKKAPKKRKASNNPTHYQPGHDKPGPGRPKGSQNRVTKALRDMILGALDRVGGEEYLAKLAIENSSAFASLVAKVLPSTLQTSESDGGSNEIVFRRIIVYPGGREEIEGVTPKNCRRQLPTSFPATATILTYRSISTRNQVLSFLRPSVSQAVEAMAGASCQIASASPTSARVPFSKLP